MSTEVLNHPLLVLSNLNNIPEELLKEIPRLEPGQVVTFRSLRKETVIDAEGRDPDQIIYPAFSLGYRDTLLYKGKRIPIGIPKEIENDKVKSFASDLFGVGKAFFGKFSVRGGNVDDEAKYYFLMLSNLREDNPHRDKSVKPVYRLIDTLRDAKDERKVRNIRIDAMNLANNMNLNEIRDYACALNMDEHQDADVLRNLVENYAENNPKEFITNQTSPAFKQKATIKRAVDKGIIIWDNSSRRVKWSDTKNTPITVIEKSDDNDDWLLAFAEYCISTKAGETVLAGIRKKVKEAIIQSVSDGENE